MKLSGLYSNTSAVIIAQNAIPNPSTSPTRAPPAADHWPTHEITLASTSAMTRFDRIAITYGPGSGCALSSAARSGEIPEPASQVGPSTVNQPAANIQCTTAATITAQGFTLFIVPSVRNSKA